MKFWVDSIVSCQIIKLGMWVHLHGRVLQIIRPIEIELLLKFVVIWWALFPAFINLVSAPNRGLLLTTNSTELFLQNWIYCPRERITSPTVWDRFILIVPSFCFPCIGYDASDMRLWSIFLVIKSLWIFIEKFGVGNIGTILGFHYLLIAPSPGDENHRI